MPRPPRLLLALLLAAACGTGATQGAPPPSPSPEAGAGSSSGSSSGSSLDASSDAGASSVPDGGPASLAPTTLASNLPFNPGAMVSDGVDLFLAAMSTNGGVGAIWKLPVTGGTPTLLASNAWAPQEEEFIAVDATNVYFLQSDPTTQYYGPTHVTFASVPKAGGPVSTYFASPDLCSATVASGTVYFSEYAAPDGGDDAGQATVTVKAAPLDGGAVATLGTLPQPLPPPGEGAPVPTFMAASGGVLFFAGLGFPAASLGPDGGWTPLAGWDDPYPPGGSEVNVVVAGGGGAYGFGYAVTDSPLLFWQPAGTAAAVATPPPYSIVESAAFDGTHAYWSSSDGVHVVVEDGGAPYVYPAGSTFDDALFEPIAVDDAAIYWAVSPPGTSLPDGGMVWMIQRWNKAE